MYRIGEEERIIGCGLEDTMENYFRGKERNLLTGEEGRWLDQTGNNRQNANQS